MESGRRPSLSRVNALDRNVVRLAPELDVSEIRIDGDNESVRNIFNHLGITRPEALGIPVDAWTDFARSRPSSGELHYNGRHPERDGSMPFRAKSLDVDRTSSRLAGTRDRRVSADSFQEQRRSGIYGGQEVIDSREQTSSSDVSDSKEDRLESLLSLDGSEEQRGSTVVGETQKKATAAVTDSKQPFHFPVFATENEQPKDLQSSVEEPYGSTGSHSSDSSERDVQAALTPTLTTRLSWSSWKMLDLLGSGSFGAVYKAVGNDGNFFAVKEVSLLNADEQSSIQLEQEVALLSRCQHENIVQYLGSQRGDNELYIFLELVTQGSLVHQYRQYPLFDDQIRRYTKQILKGLAYLHDRNVVHRDIKCANILVHAHGIVKLADFGMAKQLDNIHSMRSAKGSVYWMAPEVVHPQKTSSYPADIWSLGCTVLEMATGKPPFSHMEWHTVFWKLGRGEIPSIPEEVPADARDFIAACLQADPSRRPSAKSLLSHPFVKTPVAVTVEAEVSAVKAGSQAHQAWSVSTRVDSMRTARSVRTRQSVFVDSSEATTRQ